MLKLIANRKVLDQNHLLVITTNSHERDAMLDILEEYRKLTTGTVDKRAYLGYIGKSLVVVLDAAGGYADPNAATRFAASYLKDPSYPKPALVLAGGVCWGNPKLVEIGDVIVCDVVHSANRSTAKPDEEEIKIYPFRSSVAIDELVAQANVKIKHGELISLEVRLMSEAARDALLARVPSALGGDMEAFAFVPECQGIPWLVVKAVSDFGTFEESRETQPDAARNAARVVQHLVERFEATRAHHPSAADATAHGYLIRALHGQSIEINFVDLNAANINASINSYFSQVETSIAIHTNAFAVHSGLPYDVTRLLLEIASNAFRHGRARTVKMDFDACGVVYEDDGTEFDAETLTKTEPGRGGKATYLSFIGRHVGKGTVSVRATDYKNANRFRIEIPLDISDLPKIVDKCSASLNMHRGELGLRWAQDCKVIYIDFDKIAMISFILDLCEELVEPLADGLRFVILCSDADTVTEVTKRYSDAVKAGQIRFIPAP